MLAVPILLSTLLAVVVEAATIQVAVGSKGLVRHSFGFSHCFSVHLIWAKKSTGL